MWRVRRACRARSDASGGNIASKSHRESAPSACGKGSLRSDQESLSGHSRPTGKRKQSCPCSDVRSSVRPSRALFPLRSSPRPPRRPRARSPCSPSPRPRGPSLRASTRIRSASRATPAKPSRSPRARRTATPSPAPRRCARPAPTSSAASPRRSSSRRARPRRYAPPLKPGPMSPARSSSFLSSPTATARWPRPATACPSSRSRWARTGRSTSLA